MFKQAVKRGFKNGLIWKTAQHSNLHNPSQQFPLIYLVKGDINFLLYKLLSTNVTIVYKIIYFVP